MGRGILIATCAMSLVAATSSGAQDFNLLLGARGTGSDDSLAYLSFTTALGSTTSDGWVLRFDTEATDISFAGANSDQNMYRLLVGYSFPLGTNTFTALAGPTHVDRDVGVTKAISETGYYLGLEGSGFVGDRGFWAGIAQWSSPDEAFYSRVFGTYQVAGTTSLGPDFSYLHESNYERSTLGLRASWVIGNTVLGVIGGASRQDGRTGPSETDGFLEVQTFFTF